MHFVDRRRGSDFLVIAGAHVLVGDLHRDLCVDVAALCKARSRRNSIRRWKSGCLSIPGFGPRRQKPDLDQRRKGGRAPLIRRQSGKGGIEIGLGECQVGLGDRLAVDGSDDLVVLSCRRQDRRGASAARASPQQTSAARGCENSHLGRSPVRARWAASRTCDSGEISAEAPAIGSVDIGKGPSYLSFDFASRMFPGALLCIPAARLERGKLRMRLQPASARHLKGPLDGQSRRSRPQDLRLLQ